MARAREGGDGDLLACLEALGRFSRMDAAREAAGADRGRLLADLGLVVEISKRVEALAASLAARAERAGAALREKGTDVASHLRQAHDLSGGQAKKLVKQGQALRGLDVIDQAARQGLIDPAQAGACAKELADFPADVLGDEALADAQRDLVGQAAGLGAKQIGRQARKRVDAARREAGVGGRADRLDRDRDRAIRERFLSFKADGASMRITGSCPVEDGVRIKARLAGAAQAIRRARTDRAAGGGAGWVSQPGGEPGGEPWGAPAAVWGPGAVGGPEPEPFAASLMDALVALADLEPPGGAPLAAGKPARLVVTMTLDQLRSMEPEGCLDETGEPLAPSAARQARCDGELVRAVVGARGQVLDIGRATRAIPEALRTALALRDGGCVFPSCAMPPSACQAHHLRPWGEGGPTRLSNLALACPVHHRLVEPAAKLADGAPWRPGMDNPDRWRIEIDPVHQHPVAIPPARFDPARRPILNDRIKAKLQDLGAIPEPAPPPPTGAGTAPGQPATVPELAAGWRRRE